MENTIFAHEKKGTAANLVDIFIGTRDVWGKQMDIIDVISR